MGDSGWNTVARWTDESNEEETEEDLGFCQKTMGQRNTKETKHEQWMIGAGVDDHGCRMCDEGPSAGTRSLRSYGNVKTRRTFDNASEQTRIARRRGPSPRLRQSLHLAQPGLAQPPLGGSDRPLRRTSQPGIILRDSFHQDRL